jgi:hypothetical protein
MHFFKKVFGFILYHGICGCMFCVLLFNCVNCVFLLLCYVLLLRAVIIFMCSFVSVYCVVLCTVCVPICTVLLPPGVNPIAVKYIISYHIIISYLISYNIISYRIISYILSSSHILLPPCLIHSVHYQTISTTYTVQHKTPHHSAQ